MDIQEKTDMMAEKARSIGLDINIDKTKVLRMNTRVTQPIQLFGEDIAEVDEFVYLGSLMSVDGSSDAEVKARLSRARHAFRTLRSFWRNKNISQNTKGFAYQMPICGL